MKIFILLILSIQAYALQINPETLTDKTFVPDKIERKALTDYKYPTQKLTNDQVKQIIQVFDDIGLYDHLDLLRKKLIGFQETDILYIKNIHYNLEQAIEEVVFFCDSDKSTSGHYSSATNAITSLSSKSADYDLSLKEYTENNPYKIKKNKLFVEDNVAHLSSKPVICINIKNVHSLAKVVDTLSHEIVHYAFDDEKYLEFDLFSFKGYKDFSDFALFEDKSSEFHAFEKGEEASERIRQTYNINNHSHFKNNEDIFDKESMTIISKESFLEYFNKSDVYCTSIQEKYLRTYKLTKEMINFKLTALKTTLSNYNNLLNVHRSNISAHKTNLILLKSQEGASNLFDSVFCYFSDNPDCKESRTYSLEKEKSYQAELDQLNEAEENIKLYEMYLPETKSYLLELKQDFSVERLNSLHADDVQSVKDEIVEIKKRMKIKD